MQRGDELMLRHAVTVSNLPQGAVCHEEGGGRGDYVLHESRAHVDAIQFVKLRVQQHSAELQNLIELGIQPRRFDVIKHKSPVGVPQTALFLARGSVCIERMNRL